MARKNFISQTRDGIKERQTRVMQLLATGLSYAQIAERTGLTKSGVADAVARARAQAVAEQPAGDAA